MTAKPTKTATEIAAALAAAGKRGEMIRNFSRMALCSDGCIRAIYDGNVILIAGGYHRRGWHGITW